MTDERRELIKDILKSLFVNYDELTNEKIEELTEVINCNFYEYRRDCRSDHKPKTVWELKQNDLYYYVDESGYVISDKWTYPKIEEKRREIGNVFLTKEEADQETERRKVVGIMKKHGGTTTAVPALKGGFTVSFDPEIGWRPNCSFAYAGAVYFDDIETCQKAIDEIGQERLSKVFLGEEE